jgi:predicted O-methyltransferase YrrM
MDWIAWARLRLGLRHIAGYDAIDGFLTEKEAVELYRLATAVPRGGSVVEIGSWKGKSTYCLARGLRTGTLHAIDPFDGSGDAPSQARYEETRGEVPLLEQFRRNLAPLGLGERVQPWVGTSSDFVGRFPQIDLLFIDGDHSVEACDFDFRSFAPCLVRGGVLALHDYDAARKDFGPTFVAEQRVLPSGDYEFRGLVDSLWTARRR